MMFYEDLRLGGQAVALLQKGGQRWHAVIGFGLGDQPALSTSGTTMAFCCRFIGCVKSRLYGIGVRNQTNTTLKVLAKQQNTPSDPQCVQQGIGG
jgi:hypothetical protein